MTNEEFIKEVFQIVCGHGATCSDVENNDNEVKAREFTKEEVLDQIREYIDHSLKYEEEKESCKAIFEKEPEKPKTTQEHFDKCLRHWSRHG
jgi:hypothetical protein